MARMRRFFLMLRLLVLELSASVFAANNVELLIADKLALTTTFTQPAQCTSGALTEVALYSSQIWENVVNPVPGSTFSSCYPGQFYSSIIATSSLPPFSALICPYNWETYNITDTYIICCPNNYGLYAPNTNNADRPGEDAVCYSTIWASELMDIYSYDSTAFVTFFGTSAGTDGTIAYAFDGTAAIPGSTTAIATSTPTSATGSTLTSHPDPKTSTTSSGSSPTAGNGASSLASPTSSGAVCSTFATSIARSSIHYLALAFLAWLWHLA